MAKGPKNMFKAISYPRRLCGVKYFLGPILTQNRVFWRFFQVGVPMCANTFWWGARPKKGRKGHTCVGKVVRPRYDT